MKKYLLKNLIAWDMAICALIFPKAKERETISGYLGLNYPHSVFTLWIDWVFYREKFWPDKTHCEDVADTESKFIK